MKTKLFLSLATLSLVVFLFTGCAAPATETPPATEPPAVAAEPTIAPEPTADPAAATVREMLARVNAGDYPGAAELFAPDAVMYFLGMPPTGFEFYRGRDAFLAFMEACCTGQNFAWEVNPTAVTDGVVWAKSQTWMDFTRELGVAPNDFNEVFIVEDGLIAGYWSSMTEEALAEFKPALCAALPEACQPPGDPPSGEPVSELAITIQDGTCAYDGSMVVKAGDVAVTSHAADTGGNKYAVSLFTLEEGHDFVDLMATTPNAGPPDWSDMVFLDEVAPGETATKSFTAQEGLLYMICWGDPPSWAIGQAGPFEVRP